MSGSLPPAYVALGRGIVDAIAPQAYEDARRHGPEQARAHAVRELDAAIAAIPPQRLKALACVEGCAFCCHRQVAANAAEVFGLLEHLRATLDAEAFDAFRARCLATAQRVAPMSPAQRAAHSIACPALVDGACSGYAARPLRCRAYNSLDVEPCRRFFESPQAEDAGPPADLDRYVFAQAVMFGLYAGLERAGLDTRHYELATALAEALSDPTASARYHRGERAFLAATLIGE